jgi:ribosomal-protein-alanine N-acetyltransferase
LEFVFQHFTDPDIGRYLHDEELITTRRGAKAIIDFYIEPGARLYNRWLIIDKSGNLPIGTCGYHNWQKKHFRAEIGYDLGKASWRQGFMTEALVAVLKFGFEQMELNRIEAFVHPGNHASIRLLQRLNFREEGHLRDYYFQSGQFHDTLIFSLIGKESLSTRDRAR